MARYLIGIDLGTTNSALAYIDLEGPLAPARRSEPRRPVIRAFPVPQLVAPAEVADRELLPSFLYLPGAHDLPPGATALPWEPNRNYAVGEFARNHGARVPGRLVTSAKSWLCHTGVDRTAPLLPWSAPPDVSRISPVEASARFLRHLVESWNSRMAPNSWEDRLEKLPVILTVPASFDDVARNLTVEAARLAGLEKVTLLEEPQAAFYCWLAAHTAGEAAQIHPGARCLVIDVGGGTSDLSLIQAVEQQGELGFVRQAVGDHLLLGGDNMDLALAKSVETHLPGAGRLDATQYGMLAQACRLAKETLLAPQPPASFTVTVMGRGRQVIGGALHATLTPADVRQVIFEGFFPVVPGDAEPVRGARVGLHEMGLPYVSDAGISRHLAAFLHRHLPTSRDTTAESTPPRRDDAASLATDQSPQAILFNGGVFQPASLRERMIEVLRHWYDQPGRPWHPLVLTNPSLDLAVALGAAYYAWLRHTGGKRIGGGIARSYYIAVESKGRDKEAPAMPGDARAPVTVICVVPQHLEEGKEITLEKPELELALGQPVKFPLFTSTVRADDKAGAVLQVQPEQLLQLPPLHTILRGGKRAGAKSVPVKLAAKSTEIGTLELWCVAREGNNRWRLEFNVREIVRDEPDAEEFDPSLPEGASQTEKPVTDVWLEEQVQEAARLIRNTYSDAEAGGPDPRDLTRALERVLETSRQEWPTGLCRRLVEFLFEVAEQRRRSPAHLGRWFNLVGYCLRPGFGDALDKFRVDQLWKLMHVPPRAEPGRPVVRLTDGGADYWIMWRRVAGGLSAPLHQALFNRVRPGMMPGKSKGAIKPGANELAEMWRAAGSLERLDGKQKELLGQNLVWLVRRSPVPHYAFWALTRIGARVLLYGPLNTVVHPQVVETWLEALLGFAPGNDNERLAWAFCLAQLARKSGQRALDVDDKHRRSVLNALGTQRVPFTWVRMVEDVIQSDGDEQSKMFGESLPIGLRLVSEEGNRG